MTPCFHKLLGCGVPSFSGAVMCSLLARFFKILLNKARTEDELDNMRRGGGGSRSVGNGAAGGPAATRPAAPPAAARPGTFDTMKTK